jgi:hypothetical protein
MKRKAPPHGKKESADMHTQMAADCGKTDNRAERRNGESETAPSERILELRGRIRSGFYDSKEVIMEIVEKLFDDIKSPKK